MESVQNFFDEEGHFAVDFDVFDESQIQDQLGIESPVVSAKSCRADLNTVTLASLNTHSTDSEYLFDLGFEGGDFDCVVDLTSDTNRSKVKQEESFRSPSPMSMTASLSGSEPYSSPRQSEMDETDQDLLEYLLEDSNITHQDGDDDNEDGTTVASSSMSSNNVRELTRSKTLMPLTLRRNNSSILGVGNQSGPWCKTKNRNGSKNAIAARENRQKKKMYLQTLEDANEQLNEENSRLKTESTQAKKKISSLEGEVQYLRKVLFNQSSLAGLLKKMNQSDVRLSFNGDESQQDDASSSSSGGLCLHVDGEDASLKFCASCARKDHPYSNNHP
ncbi:CREB/ATF bZIP transcription factor-like [Patiria miniata]|uniref:BZIP domain-containing protein n=1 Tax=Patiria miniata TaxID=46514 RepID=A0A914BRA8_PATMI|nr:CREB/ATF bZIP transcription factor-like [Patiria miniata]